MSRTILLFLIGFIFLIKGGDWFVESAAGIARRFHLPELLIGATIVSIGTTLPEVMVSVSAALKGSGGISYGNAIGSVICNTALIAAVTIAARPDKVERDSLILPSVCFFAASLFYACCAWTRGRFGRADGLVLLAGFVIYMMITVLYMRRHPSADEGNDDASGSQRGFKDSLPGEIFLIIVGAALIAAGSDLLVDNGIIIAGALGIPESVVGLTMVALGTSLPELITAITSVIHGHGALSLGNIIGANLFNLVLVSGTAITIAPFRLPAERLVGGVSSSLIVDLPLMLIVMLILIVPALIRGRLYRAQGVLLLIIYAGFTIYQFLG